MDFLPIRKYIKDSLIKKCDEFKQSEMTNLFIKQKLHEYVATFEKNIIDYINAINENNIYDNMGIYITEKEYNIITITKKLGLCNDSKIVQYIKSTQYIIDPLLEEIQESTANNSNTININILELNNINYLSKPQIYYLLPTDKRTIKLKTAIFQPLDYNTNIYSLSFNRFTLYLNDNIKNYHRMIDIIYNMRVGFDDEKKKFEKFIEILGVKHNNLIPNSIEFNLDINRELCLELNKFKLINKPILQSYTPFEILDIFEINNLPDELFTSKKIFFDDIFNKLNQFLDKKLNIIPYEIYLNTRLNRDDKMVIFDTTIGHIKRTYHEFEKYVYTVLIYDDYTKKFKSLIENSVLDTLIQGPSTMYKLRSMDLNDDSRIKIIFVNINSEIKAVLRILTYMLFQGLIKIENISNKINVIISDFYTYNINGYFNINPLIT